MVGLKMIFTYWYSWGGILIYFGSTSYANCSIALGVFLRTSNLTLQVTLLLFYILIFSTIPSGTLEGTNVPKLNILSSTKNTFDFTKFVTFVECCWLGRTNCYSKMD